ncbi:MAG: hypothetical protein D6B26_05475, partial [Spirochaetaceae bacterium]
SEDNERIVPGEDGYSGVRTRVYRLSTRDVGTFQLDIPGMVWYSPSENELYQYPQRHIVLKVLPVPLGGGRQESSQLGMMTREQLGLGYATGLSSSWLVFLWGLPVILGVAFRRLISSRSGRAIWIVLTVMLVCLPAAEPYTDIPQEKLSVAMEAFDRQDYGQANDLFLELKEEYPYVPGLWYNAGIAAYWNDSPAEAVHFFRRAVVMRPGDKQIRQALEWAENTLELDSQIGLPPDTGAESFSSLAMLCLLAMSALWLFFRVRRMGGMLVVVLSLGILFGVTFGAAMRFAYQEGRMAGVLVGSGESNAGVTDIYKIPAEEVEPWMDLASGTAVWMLDIAGNFVLIETGPGVRAWVKRDQIAVYSMK